MPGEVITLPPTTMFPTRSQERELQSTCLDANALFGLLIVLSVWTVFDVIHKVYFLIKRECRRRYGVRSANAQADLTGIRLSERDVENNGFLMAGLPTLVPATIRNRFSQARPVTGILE